jgi:hypothetical protein
MLSVTVWGKSFFVLNFKLFYLMKDVTVVFPLSSSLSRSAFIVRQLKNPSGVFNAVLCRLFYRPIRCIVCEWL